MIDMEIIINNKFNHGNTPEQVLNTIDFSEWTFAIDIESMVHKAVAEAFRNTLAEAPPAIEFASDGTSIDLSLQCGSNWNDGVIYFRAKISDMIGNFIANTDPADMDGGLDARTALAKCLRDCANKLDAVI